MANTLDNLANVYLRQGKYEQAEPLYQRSLSIKEKNLGPDHPSLTFTLNPLAELYRAQGKHETAEHFYQRALTIREKARRVATTPENGAAIPTSERDALIALYSSTDGDNWSPRNDNWRKAPGVFNDTGTECTWFGVGCGGGATKTTVLRLDLNSNRLREAIPPELGNLTNLRGLFLAGNQLYTAP